MRTAVLLALVLLVVGVVLATFVRWLRRRRQDKPESWWALVVASIGAVVKVLVCLAVLAGLCLHLLFESEEFARLRGGVTQRNYDAVKTIWGRPHVQRELYVRMLYYTTHYYDKDHIELDPEKLKATTQLVPYRKETYTHEIPGNPITEAEHNFIIRKNYRSKGGALYPGFETDCTFRYRVVNLAGRAVDLDFRFPLPARQGLIDQLSVAVDGRELKGAVVRDETVTWKLPAEPAKEFEITIGYRSRGLDHLRFEPGAGRKLRKYRITMTCLGIREDEVNYPVGCMTPMKRDPCDDDTVLTWQLDNAVTRLGMGVIIPKPRQEGYHVARILSAAPWGLILLAGMAVLTPLARGRRLHWAPLLLLAVAYHLYCLLMAHVGDYSPGLLGGMLIAAVVLTVFSAVLQLAWQDGFTAVANIAMFLVFVVAYPLIRISEHEGLLLTVLYVALLGWAVFLAVLQRPRAKHPPAEAEALPA